MFWYVALVVLLASVIITLLAVVACAIKELDKRYRNESSLIHERNQYLAESNVRANQVINLNKEIDRLKREVAAKSEIIGPYKEAAKRNRAEIDELKATIRGIDAVINPRRVGEPA